jgi:regulator of replication initiation timing
MSARIWDLEQELAAATSQLEASCDEVDRLVVENSSLRERLCEYVMFFDDSQEVSRPSPDNRQQQRL